MAGVTFLIRVIPLTLIRKPINNVFLRSFLYYVPYVTLAVMTFPAIVDATGYPLAGLIAFVLLQSSIFTREYTSGTLTLSLTKGLARYKVVLSKPRK